MDTISIEPATLEDLSQLADLLAELFTLEGDFTPDRAKQLRGLRLILEQSWEKLGPKLRGKLHVYVAEDWLPHTWDERVTERVTIERPPALRTAVDGEPVELGPRVELGIEPSALRILVP